MSRSVRRPRVVARLVAGLAASVALGLGGGNANAEPAQPVAETGSSWSASRSLLQHFGVEAAHRLLGGTDVRDEVLRGVDRAVAVGTPEGLALLVHLLSDAHGPTHSDARVLLATTRALAPFATQSAVAHALADAVLNGSGVHAPPGRGASSEAGPPAPDPDRRARVELARATAALALANAGGELATDLLASAARRPGPGQAAATRALSAMPPVAGSLPSNLTPATILLYAATGDLRARDAILEATRSLDTSVRSAALRASAALGDVRAIVAAELALHEPDAPTRVAATRVLVELGAASAAHAVRLLIEDDETAERGIELSLRVSGDEIIGALSARVRVSSDLALRRAAIQGLGRANDANAVRVLTSFLVDPELAGDAAEAIARSNAPTTWDAILEALSAHATRRLGARMAALHGRAYGGTPDRVSRSLRELARSADGADRAAGLASRVLLGEQAPTDGLADADVRVRRAVAMACEPTDPQLASTLLARLTTETDSVTRLLLARGLELADHTPLTTTALGERLRTGGPDAPLAALALARIGDARDRELVVAALESPDPLLRAHTARGLADSPEAWAVPLLSEAYDAEVDSGVRRSLVLALASRRNDSASPLRARALDRATRLDPDPGVRAIAERALGGLPAPELSRERDVVWLRIMTDTGAPPPSPVALGVLVRSDGIAAPVAFDDDGYALIPAPKGPARLLLAPRLRPYQAEPHAD